MGPNVILKQETLRTECFVVERNNNKHCAQVSEGWHSVPRQMRYIYFIMKKKFLPNLFIAPACCPIASDTQCKSLCGPLERSNDLMQLYLDLIEFTIMTTQQPRYLNCALPTCVLSHRRQHKDARGQTPGHATPRQREVMVDFSG